MPTIGEGTAPGWLLGSSGSARDRCCCHGHRNRRWSGNGRIDGHLTGDANTQIVLFDLDFRQVGLVEQAGELTNQVVVDCGFLVGHVAFRSLWASGPDHVGEGFDGEAVTGCAEPANDAMRHRRHEGMVPKILPGEDVRQVDFDGRNLGCPDGVVNGH